MKRELLVISAICISLFLKSQSYTQWGKLCDPVVNSNCRINHIFEFGNCFVVEGYSNNNPQSNNFVTKFLNKIDGNGNFIEKKQMTINNYSSFDKIGNSILKLNDRLINATYSINNDNSKNKISPVLIVFDSNLEIMVYKTYSDSVFSPFNGNSYFTDVVMTSDSNLMLTGNLYQNQYYYNGTPFIMKTDLNGNVLWIKKYPDSYQSFYHLFNNSDSTFTVFAEKNKGSFVTIDSIGNIIFELSINNIDAENLKADKAFDGDKLYLARRVNDTVNADTILYKINLTCYNSATKQIVFDITTSHGIYTPNLIGDYTLKLIDPITINVKDSKIYVATSDKYYVDYDNFPSLSFEIPKLFIYNDLGDLITTQQCYIKSWPTEQMFDFEFTNDNCILGVGYDWDYNKSFIFKSNSFIGLGFSEKKEKKPMHLFPNPTYDYLSFVDLIEPNSTIEIFNETGQLLISQKLIDTGQEHKINVNNLPAGVYFVRLISSNQMIYYSKFIKQVN